MGLAESSRSADKIQFQSVNIVNGTDQITFYGMMFLSKVYFFLERGNFECFFFHIKKNKTADYDWTVSILKPTNLSTNSSSFL